MLSFFRWVLFFVALLVTLMGGALLLGHQMLVAQGPLDKTKNVLIRAARDPPPWRGSCSRRERFPIRSSSASR